jgi:TrmH family RNA methyltransferase
MISKPKVRFIKSLQVKKYRLAEQCFLVQGAKAVGEVLDSDFCVELLCATESFLDSTKLASRAAEVVVTSEKELSSLGSVETNNAALAVVRMKPPGKPPVLKHQFGLILDDIRDPGNLGAIIRTADWYGITTIVASTETTDQYNPKVISASMGSFIRVNFYTTSLPEWLKTIKLPVWGTFLVGIDVHRARFGDEGWIVVGNESKGISSEVAACVTNRITIPRTGKAESLNASVAAAVVLDNLLRGRKLEIGN